MILDVGLRALHMQLEIELRRARFHGSLLTKYFFAFTKNRLSFRETVLREILKTEASFSCWMPSSTLLGVA